MSNWRSETREGCCAAHDGPGGGCSKPHFFPGGMNPGVVSRFLHPRHGPRAVAALPSPRGCSPLWPAKEGFLRDLKPPLDFRAGQLDLQDGFVHADPGPLESNRKPPAVLKTQLDLVVEVNRLSAEIILKNAVIHPQLEVFRHGFNPPVIQSAVGSQQAGRDLADSTI